MVEEGLSIQKDKMCHLTRQYIDDLSACDCNYLSYICPRITRKSKMLGSLVALDLLSFLGL